MNTHPRPLRSTQFYGPIGDLVKRIMPYTEASCEAVYFQLISALGCMAGRNSFQVIDGKDHHMRIFVVLVGSTSQARKGTSLGWVKKICRVLDPKWTNERWANGGLSTGEGLIFSVRDASASRKKAESDDPGVDDKRLFFGEEEFARLLKAMKRDSNTLSSVIRCCWDGSNLQSHVKTDPYKSTAPHTTIVGHITQEELKRNFCDVDSFNGFANRFLWIYTKRSKLLAIGPELPVEELNRFVDVLQPGLAFAREERKFTLNSEAKSTWVEAYENLNIEYSGVFGAFVTRGSAQVRRLAMLFAAFDQVSGISSRHLQAAIDAWEYCQKTCRWLFPNGNTGNKIADKIFGVISKCPRGMSRTEISKALNGNVSKESLDDAFDLLESNKLAYFIEIATGGKVKETRWYSQKTELSEE